jgi:hypothetical protein
MERPRHPQCESLGAALRVSPPVDAPSRLGFKCTHSVVTALYGGYDTLIRYPRSFRKELVVQEKERGIRTCWFAFTDAASLVSDLSVQEVKMAEAAHNATSSHDQRWIRAGLWHLVILPEAQLTASLPEHNKLRSRLPKMMAHCVLGYSSKMIYLDAKVSLKRPASIWRMLPPPASAWVSPLHPIRSSVRDELVCLYLSGIVTERAFEQLRAYHAVGFPSNLTAQAGGPGLSEGEWHARDLVAADSTAIGNAWFTEWWRWGQHNLRDQISFNYVIWRLGLLPPHVETDSPATAHTGSAVQVPEPVRGFTHFLGYIEQPRPPCCSPAWHRWASARANRSFISHQGHTVARTSLTIEDTFTAEHWGQLPPKKIEDLKQGHRWCDYVSFGLDNAGLLSNLSSLMQNGIDAHQKPTTEPQGLDDSTQGHLDTRGPGAWQAKDDCATLGKCGAGDGAPEGQSGEVLQGAQ